MSTDLSLKDQLDLVQKVWLEYSAKQRQHHTLQITLAGLFATSLIGGGIAVKNFPNLLGVLHGDLDLASATILIGVGAATIVLALASFYETSQARKWKRLSDMVFNELTVSSVFRTIADFNDKEKRTVLSAITSPPQISG